MSSYHFVATPMEEGAQLLSDMGSELVDETKY
jgi:hypothetical protein